MIDKNGILINTKNFGADLEKEYSQNLKKAIKEDKSFGSIAEWIRFYGDKYLKEKKKKI